MKNLNKWCAGKKIGTILLARDAVSGADAFFQFFKWFHEGKPIPKIPPPPPLKDWLKLYRDNKRILYWLCTHEEKEPMGWDEFREFVREWQKLANLPQAEREEAIKQELMNLTPDERRAIVDEANEKLRNQD